MLNSRERHLQELNLMPKEISGKISIDFSEI